MATSKIKEEARKLADELPDDATWEQLEYRNHVRRKIEAGLNSLEKDEALSTEEVRQQMGLPRNENPLG